ncbi:TolB family protein [Sphingobium scionense]
MRSTRAAARRAAADRHGVRAQSGLLPDGKQFAFLSDRSGVTNLWIANVDGTGLKQLSQDQSLAIYASPAWSPDGRHVYVSRTVHSILAFELFLYDRDGGSGIQITKAGSPDNWDAKMNAMGAVATPDVHSLLCDQARPYLDRE